MAKNGVTSNFQKFNKNQQALIKRFGIGVTSSIADAMIASMTLARDSGIEHIQVDGMEKKNPPLKIGGKYIYNPIWSKSAYREAKEKKDTKKVLDRTGTLKNAFDFFARFPMPKLIEYSEKAETHYIIFDRIKDVARVRIGFLGTAAKALNNVTAKDAGTRLRGRRRFVESAFSKVKAIFKKSMINKRLVESRNLT